MNDGIMLVTPWLIPLSRGNFRSIVTRRLTTARVLSRDGIQYIDCRLPLNRDTRRFGATDRVRIRSRDGEYLGVIERTSSDRDQRTLLVRVV
jgi:hypothetical protein